MRDSTSTGAIASQPSSTQYGSKAENLVSCSSVSHLVADT